MDPILQDNIRCIEQALSLIDLLPPGLYAAASGTALGASIGGHIRHNIDHYNSLLTGVARGEIRYDKRERKAAIETDPVIASHHLTAVVTALSKFAKTDLARPLRIRMDAGNSGWSGSTLRRELQFLLSHSVHHYAIIAILCRSQGVRVDADFGVAPSTLSYRQALAASPPVPVPVPSCVA